MGPEEGRHSKSFRVALHLCPQERTGVTEVSRASVKVVGLNRVTVDTGRGHRAQVLDFDAVWNEEASSRDIYESTAKPLVEYLLKGYNGCLITYGPSTSGESQTVHNSGERQRNLISCAADDIFNSTDASYCRVRVSFYHVSNEKIYDLLESQASEVCRIHDTEEMVLLDGLREVEVSSAQELLRVYRRGTAHRNAGVSKGDFASKSHMVFSVTVIHTRGHSDNEGVFIASKLTLVDLASSAKSEYHSATAPGIRRGFRVAPENPQEAKTLKRSLTIFRNVIFCLSATACQHVPYRESKLTRALRDCLAGNCRTCLLVTLATQSTSVTETISCLQFAARAMNVPSRVIHTSLTRYTSAQVPDVWTTEKRSTHLPRAQGCPPITTDRRSQPTLLPILANPGPLQPPGSKSRSGSSVVALGGSFFPYLQPLNGHLGHAVGFMDGRYTDANVCVVKGVVPRSPRLPFGVAPERDSVLTSHQHYTVKHSSSSSSSSLVSSPTLGTVSECLNCRQERKIREEYDKFIIQVKRDRDYLSERVTELERELENRERREERETGREVRQGENGREVRKGETGREVRKGETGREVRQGETGREVRHGETRREVRQGETGREVRQGETGREVRQGETKREVRQGETGREVRQAEEKRAKKEETRRRKEEESENEERDSKRPEGESKDEKGAVEEREESEADERNEGEQESDSSGKESCGTPLSAPDARHSSEVCLENAALKARLKALLKVINSKMCSGCHGNTNTHATNLHMNTHSSHTQTDAHFSPPNTETHSSHTQTDAHSSHTHKVTTNTEMVVVSHCVSQQCTNDLLQGSKCYFSSSSGFPIPSEPGFAERPAEPVSHACPCESKLHKTNFYKQLRREHSLLLEVMLVLYRRQWFLQDAMPYVRRTLTKCGLTLEEAD